MTAPKPAPDWERIELEYRAGILTLREIASLHGITHGAVNKRAKRDGWARDLNAKVLAKAEELVAKKSVSAEVSKRKADTEGATIHALGYQLAEIKLGRRARVVRAQGLAEKLRSELAAMTDNRELFETLGETMRSADERGQDRLNDTYRAVIAFPMRVKALKELTDVDRMHFAMEGEAFGIAAVVADPGAAPDGPAPDRIKNPGEYYAWFRSQGAKT